MLTLKIPYSTTEDNKSIILKLMMNQNNVIKCCYNFLKKNENINQKEVTKYLNSLNNIFIDSWFKQSAYYESRSLSERDKVIFGGKKLFKQRSKNKITKEEFKIKKLLPLSSIGESTKKGNRKFNILNNQILFKPDKITKIYLNLPKLRKNYKNILNKLEILSYNNKIPLLFKVDMDFIYISYDENLLNENNSINLKENRICSLDLNPNYIGYSIIEWNTETNFKVLSKGIIDFSKLKDPNKRKHEIINAIKFIINKTIHYKCSSFAIEDLNIKNQNHLKGKKFNKQINNDWKRKLIKEQINKRCSLNKIEVIKVFSQYSSIVGNLFFNELNYPDQILSSIEINRRVYLFKNKKLKGNFYPSLSIEKLNIIMKSLEERNNNQEKFNLCWKDIFSKLKTSKMRYRVLLEEIIPFKSFKLKYSKNKTLVYEYC